MIKPRPKHLNLIQIQLPLPGVVSFLHRISGAGLFLFIPLVLFLLQSSLASPEGFETVKQIMSGGFAKFILLGLTWALLHHFFAGLRFLALDMHWGVTLQAARRTGLAVMVGSLSLTLLLGVWLW